MIHTHNAMPTYPPQPHSALRQGLLNRRPRLLFLAYFFPPTNTIGCVRTWNITKYLTRLGWDITVVTPHSSLWRHVENPEVIDAKLKQEGIQRILTDHRWRCLAPEHLSCWNQGLGWFAGGICRKMARRYGIDRGIGWIKAAERACAMLTAKDVDIILASGKPFAAFRLAKRLSDRLGRPYVLDYRDPWVGNPHHTSQSIVIQEETRLLADCAVVTIVSRSWGLAMERRFGLGPKLHVLTNGYDPEELRDVIPHEFGHFAIVYTGTFYPPNRVISPVMAALKRLKDTTYGKGVTWYFHYYGQQEDHVCKEATRFGVSDQVVLHGMVSRAEALSAVGGADIAVVITSLAGEGTLADRGMVTGKVFEALGLKTPILLVTPSGSDAEVVAQTTGLARSFPGNDIDGMASFLREEMISGKALEPRNLNAFAWTHIARKLDTILRGLL